MSCVLGLDIGGTFIKGLVLKDGEAVFESSTPTRGGEGIADCVEGFVEELAAGAGITFSSISGVGIGCPGVIGANGLVVRAANLGLENYPLGKFLEEKLGLPVKICNDANAAALGEAKFGAGKEYSDSILITLGTGVGGGIIIGGKLFEGNKNAGAEIGHMVIDRGGKRCTCGRYGCFEAYCSMRALTEDTREAMKYDTASEMWKISGYNDADARTAFSCMDTDGSAKKVTDRFFKYLACGVANLINVLRPQAVLIGGAVTAQGDRLIKPLKDLVEKEIFVPEYAPVEIRCASLGNRAGVFGAAALFESSRKSI